jgi:6-phosphogluconate dehydrogenase
MDCGNSFFKDTIRRSKFLKEKNIRFLGVGISGGAEGALKGPSIMPGGDKDAWFRVKEILQSISAKIEDHPCCKYLGSNGAGHYVKMVHNGIEYAIMQAIAESYHLLRDIFKLSPQKLVEVYTSWNNGELNSYLLEITRNIFETVDPETGKPLIDFIVDIAGQKGTGNWTAQNALEMGIPSNSLAQAVFARIFSANKRLRIEFAKNTNHPEKKELEISNKQKEDLRQALYCTILCAYTQGFAQLQSAKHEYNWEYDLIDISRIWQNGCIIRADLLKKIYKAFQNNPNLENLLIDTHFAKKIDKYQRAWRSINCLAINFQIPVPVISSSLTFIDSLNTEHLPANLIQAQRDYFGAHTFRRIDRESKESFHHEW